MKSDCENQQTIIISELYNLFWRKIMIIIFKIDGECESDK